jgi:hypothetical protein
MRAKITAETSLLLSVQLRVQFIDDNRKREGGKKERKKERKEERKKEGIG